MSRTIVILALVLGCLSQDEDRGRFKPPRDGWRKPPPSRPRPTTQNNNYEPFTFEGNIGEPNSPMRTLYSWKQLDFTFPNSYMREEMIRNKQFIPINTMILDSDVYEEGSVRKVFVSLPRVRPGIPVTLATVSQVRSKTGEFLLEPFPNWEAHTALNQGNCDAGITSVFRVHVDECGRLWVLDNGSLNAFTSNATVVCQPKIWIYDLRNKNRLIGKYPIPESMIASNSLLVTIAVDIRRRQCDSAFAYIADAIAYKMIVFDLKNRQYWRVNSIQFQAYPDQGTFTINGESFDLFGGLFGLALGPVYRGDKRILYFHCIDSVRQSWADTADLRNRSLWRNSMNAKPKAFNLFRGARSSQSAAAATNEQGIMFFGLVASNELSCWNTQSKFDKSNIVRLVKDDAGLQFVSGVKLSNNKLYVASCRLQKYMNYNVNKDEVNYRVLVGDLDQMTRQTKCEMDWWADPYYYEPYTENVIVARDDLDGFNGRYDNRKYHDHKYFHKDEDYYHNENRHEEDNREYFYNENSNSKKEYDKPYNDEDSLRHHLYVI